MATDVGQDRLRVVFQAKERLRPQFSSWRMSCCLADCTTNFKNKQSKSE